MLEGKWKESEDIVEDALVQCLKLCNPLALEEFSLRRITLMKMSFCEEHTFIVRAFSKARDIQLIPNIVYGYNERRSVTAQRADTFLPI